MVIVMAHSLPGVVQRVPCATDCGAYAHAFCLVLQPGPDLWERCPCHPTLLCTVARSAVQGRMLCNLPCACPRSLRVSLLGHQSILMLPRGGDEACFGLTKEARGWFADGGPGQVQAAQRVRSPSTPIRWRTASTRIRPAPLRSSTEFFNLSWQYPSKRMRWHRPRLVMVRSSNRSSNAQTAIIFRGSGDRQPVLPSVLVQTLQQTPFQGAALRQVEGGMFFVEVADRDIKIMELRRRASQPGDFGPNMLNRSPERASGRAALRHARGAVAVRLHLVEIFWVGAEMVRVNCVVRQGEFHWGVQHGLDMSLGGAVGGNGAMGGWENQQLNT